jgi:hypothetical protein
MAAPSVFRWNDPGVELPHVVREVKPQYTLEAMVAGIMGSVRMECIVDATDAVRCSGNCRRRQSGAPRVGQIQIGDRYWIWVEQSAVLWPGSPTTGVTAAPAGQPFNLRTWLFSTTEQGQLLSAAFVVITPAALSDEETREELTTAGTTFAEMMKRIAITSTTAP